MDDRLSGILFFPQDMEADMAFQRTSSLSTIDSLSVQLQQFSERLHHLESVREEQEGTIRIKQEETHVAARKITVSGQA